MEPALNAELHEEATNGNGRKDLYKCKGVDSSVLQEERRIEILQRQKKDREKNFNSKRFLELFDFTDEEIDDGGDIDERELVEEITSMEITKSPNKNKYKKRGKRYGHVLMHSEWMMEVPTDLEDNWYFMPCPAGKRCLLVAQGGKTRSFSSRGKLLATFKSLLPGGNEKHDYSRFSILDCIWCYKSTTYYIIDVLAWGNQHLTDCEGEFRFSWLSSKCDEIEGLSTIQRGNRHKIIPLPCKKYSKIEIEKLMNETLIYSEVIDGILFYHKQGHYLAGQVPTVLWLLPFMLPEVLGVSINDVLDAQKPIDYPGHLEFIEKFQGQDRYNRRLDYRRRKAASRSVIEGSNTSKMEHDSSYEEQMVK